MMGDGFAMGSAAKKRIVIVGSGFGGMAAAKALKGVDAAITLVDRTNHHLFQPLLYQVATAALSPADIATATRALLRHQPKVAVLMAEAIGVDRERRIVHLAGGRDLPYDYLVLAIGAAYSFFGQDGWRPFAPTLKTLEDALAIRARLLSAFELAEECGDPALIAKLLTFVVVGAGPTGVELAGTIAELARSTLARDFKAIDPRSARIILCEAGDRPLSAFPERLSTYAAKALRGLGVELKLGEAVKEIDSEGLIVGETRVEAANVLWCAGTEARPAGQWLGVETARNGAVKVGPDCSVPGRPEIFVIGDGASFSDATGETLPGLAPVAKQQGAYVGRLIKARIAGARPPGPFRYRNYGTMAIIGRSRAIADFGGFTLTGFPAWLTWSLVHLLLLVDFRSRLTVYVNWSWAWFTYGRGARLLAGPPRQPLLPRQSEKAAVESVKS
jgi:NADH:ubiquinone reductase (H+-translocating)